MEERTFVKNLLGFFFLICLSSIAKATTVSFEVSNQGGNTWRYDYSVLNDTLGLPLEEFTIFFEAGLFENLQSPQAPVNWDPIAIQPDGGLPDDGFYDAFSFLGGIAAGDSLDGFSVQADYLGSGTPGSQFFQVVDPDTFDVLDDGFTSAATTIVPVPAAVWLFASGLALLLRVSAKKN